MKFKVTIYTEVHACKSLTAFNSYLTLHGVSNWPVKISRSRSRKKEKILFISYPVRCLNILDFGR